MLRKEWKTVTSNVISKNKFWEYHCNTFTIDDSYVGEYHFVHTKGSSLVIPVMEDGRVLLLRQYRYLAKREGLEFPCGLIEKGISPEQNAMKELREESGFTAEKLEYAGAFAPSIGVCDEVCHIFIANKLSKKPLQPDETEEFLIEYYHPYEVDSLIRSLTIWDGLTISAWAISKNIIQKELS